MGEDSSSSSEDSSVPARSSGWLGDFLELTKARLNAMVVVTAAFGFLLASGWPPPGWLFFHTLLGCGLCALAAGALNQLMEARHDAGMERTADRPLPAGRIPEPAAFVIGWLLAAFGIVHLAVQVHPENPQAAWLGALTIVIYLFVYTPLKRVSSTNTLVGAVAGAIPPVLGWVGGGGTYTTGAWFLFGLQFAWQMPHFMAINWLCRDDYERAGFRMWAHGDESGRRSAVISLAFALLLLPISLWPAWAGLCAWWAAWAGAALALVFALACLRWLVLPGRVPARVSFFASLVYLPLAYAVYLFGWL